jgi:hypothetical protein
VILFAEPAAHQDFQVYAVALASILQNAIPASKQFQARLNCASAIASSGDSTCR